MFILERFGMSALQSKVTSADGICIYVTLMLLWKWLWNHLFGKAFGGG